MRGEYINIIVGRVGVLAKVAAAQIIYMRSPILCVKKMVFSRKVRRGSEVVRALIKNGLGWVVQHYGLHAYLPVLSRFYYTKGGRDDLPVKLRRSLEDLGGAFVKLGQMLSLREDLIPHEYAREFRKLLDSVPPVPIASVKRVIAQEFGRPWTEVFESIDASPLGSASIAQVHKAVLKSGKTVVVKVQRQDIRAVMEDDIALMYMIARRLEPRLKQHASPMKIVQEFERYTRQELDFMHEANNIGAFAKGFRENGDVRVPQVFWNHTTSRVLTMEYIDGVKLMSARLKSPRRVAQKLVDLMVYQVFDLGVFHADLHPGNILVCKNDRLAFIDFGIVGRLTADLRRKGVDLWIGMTNADLDLLVRTLESIGFPDGSLKVEKFRQDIYETVRRWGDEFDRRPSTVFRALFETALKYDISLPLDMVLLAKALLTVEGTSATIDPSFDFYEYAREKAKDLASERLRPSSVADELASKGREFAQVMYRIPQETLHFLDHVKHGKFYIDLDDTDIKHLGFDINMSSNRLSYAMLVSALAITGALTIDIGPGLGGFSALSLVFFVLAFFFVWPLAVSIFREGSEKHDPH